ncbi:peroxisomal biogenesis factor 19-like [Halichondria panicea]|uniref:peroxisomal biogenesis factor 19-like n=1 Tax=Halichondria panicea TaxID=6063 RepID=UPI00312B5399
MASKDMDEGSSPPSKSDPPAQEEVASDPELEELLDRSLGEFGKHVPTAKETSPPPKPKDTPILPLNVEAEFSEVFSEEFAAQAETQLEEAMKMMQSENPDLWKQFEDFSSTLGIPPGGVASHGESSVDSGGEAAKKSGSREESLAGVFEETLQKMKQNTEGLGSGGVLPEASEEDDDQLLKMMQGMMSSLLSKDVLYPSLTELCKQYPDWLSEHKAEISEEDYQRYSKQLEIMSTICTEFESDSEEPAKATSDKILSLMQRLQQYGQPPAELSPGDSEGAAGFLPPGGDMNPQNCSLM